MVIRRAPDLHCEQGDDKHLKKLHLSELPFITSSHELPFQDQSWNSDSQNTTLGENVKTINISEAAETSSLQIQVFSQTSC